VWEGWGLGKGNSFSVAGTVLEKTAFTGEGGKTKNQREEGTKKTPKTPPHSPDPEKTQNPAIFIEICLESLNLS